MRAFYTLLLYLLLPFVLLRLVWRGFRLRDYWRRWPERFGFVAAPGEPVAVWVHAVSVGEVNAALPLVKALVARHGAGRVLVTTMTPTGSARVREALGDQVRHCYVPYDYPGAVGRFLDRMRPRQVVVMETELWPNLFRALGRRGIALIVANARLSPRSFRGYRRVRGFARATLADVTVVAAQSEPDAQRFRDIGAIPARVQVAGNLKFELEVPAELTSRGGQMRWRLGLERPVWIAASTHDDEEAVALQAHQVLLLTKPDAVLILVPRHPQRFDAVEKLIRKQGLIYARRSAEADDGTTQVILGDSMGEMFLYFAAADLAFVGGSLVPVGGHNVLEPAAVALPVVFGPHVFNFTHACDLLVDHGAAVRLDDRSQLADTVRKLLEDPQRRRRMGEAGKAAVLASRGALARLLALLDQSAATATAREPQRDR